MVIQVQNTTLISVVKNVKSQDVNNTHEAWNIFFQYLIIFNEQIKTVTIFCPLNYLDYETARLMYSEFENFAMIFGLRHFWRMRDLWYSILFFLFRVNNELGSLRGYVPRVHESRWRFAVNVRRQRDQQQKFAD